ncbi:cupin domain-containing protein [Noviherbaspirillum cavernae]|uniref:Cupin domain-containing protein n=2 Tax=Noviherbaspirillum cavernae TaxID=2320862 RepID=A0A418X4T0_9BURK|nr:cupin domain-containing protein [Noviherbaspirillum cavernae]
MDTGNLFQHIPATLPDELTDTLVSGRQLRIERIVSRGHASPPGFWYEQDSDEWVLLVKGEAGLRFESGDRLLHLTEGMHVHIRAGERHRVEWTSDAGDTIWLAVFHEADQAR